MKSIISAFINLIHIPVSEKKISEVGSDEIRRIRMVNYIGLISMANMIFYSLLYSVLNFRLFNPAISWLLGSAFLCILFIYLNKLGNHKTSKIGVVLIIAISMLGATVIFGPNLDFQAFLLLGSFIPFFLWSFKNKWHLIFFFVLNIALYIIVEFEFLNINGIIKIPDYYIINFQRSNILVCFAGALIAIVTYMMLAKQKEDQLIAKSVELEKSQHHRDLVYSIIAHDLRSPIYSLMGVSELYFKSYDEFDDDHKKDFVKSIHDSLSRLHVLLNNLLDWTKIQSGNLPLKMEQVQLNKLVENVIELLKEQASKKNIHISNSIPRNMIINADSYMISTILRNLINNAIKFTPLNGKIYISAQANIKTYDIYVRDTGIGIPNDKVDKIFNPESDYTNIGTNNEKGTGLGLKLCNDFILAMNGKMTVVSKKEEGSTFSIEIPVS